VVKNQVKFTRRIPKRRKGVNTKYSEKTRTKIVLRKITDAVEKKKVSCYAIAVRGKSMESFQ
jgi:RecG-like helicase